MIAAFWGDHTHHEASLRVLAEANRKTSACGIHSLAEVYATMTALPVRPSLAPEQVFLLLQEITDRFTTVVLDEAEYLQTLRELAAQRFSGGKVYDALLLACARKCRAETIYTLNLKHFRQIAPDLAERIRTP
jgi:predicted nucleic acid-binding protein